MNPAHSVPACRFCAAPLATTFIDLGLSPLCQTLVEAAALDKPETFYPLHVRVCRECFLVQLPEYVAPSEIFRDYPYFSSYSDSWLEHGRRYAERMVRDFVHGTPAFVVEVASNDGYLLQHFKRLGQRILGVEPADNVAKIAIEKGIPTEATFFGRRSAVELLDRYGPADIMAANNVLAHVPDINDFVAGFATLLAPKGVLTIEFPHLFELIRNNQFDTIYHEHFSYLSITAVQTILQAHGLTIFDVERLTTHGGSLRLFVKHASDVHRAISSRVPGLISEEERAGVRRLSTYSGFEERVKATKRSILTFLVEAKRAGKSIVGYGAPGKGNTLLNYCGIRTDFLDYTVDRSPHKQGRFTPGTRIPIHAPDRIRETRPDYLLILPWNLEAEIVEQTRFIREWGGRWVVPIPELRVIE